MRDIAAIPVTVDGNHFRSMTEARFAVALTALGVNWEHEPGVLWVNKKDDEKPVWYCPDFVLPEWNLHVEVKPNFQVSDAELSKPFRLALWPMPVMIWSWADETGILSDWGHETILAEVTVDRCPQCDQVVFTGTPFIPIAENTLETLYADNGYELPSDEEWIEAIVSDGVIGWDVRVPFNHPCNTTEGGSRASWNRAMALARGWRADA